MKTQCHVDGAWIGEGLAKVSRFGTEETFGGVEESGLGRGGSLHGIEEFAGIKYMLIGGLGA